MLFAAPFEGRTPREFDATLALAVEVLETCGAPHVIWGPPIGDATVSEVHARNSMIEMAGEFSWCLVLDADEILVAERTNVKDTTLGGFLKAAREETLAGWSYGIDIVTTALLFRGHAPDIDRDSYDALPIVSSRGSQPRLFRSREARYVATGKGAPMLLHENKRRVTAPIADALIINQRHRKSWDSYQAAYEWERKLNAER